MNKAFNMLPHSDQDRLLFRESLFRRLGEWGEWETKSFPKGTVSSNRSYFGYHFVRSRQNDVFAVLERKVQGGTHLAVSSLSGERPSWWEMQRIKNELMGESTTGVEIYPPQDEVVDGANMFHIFVTHEASQFSLVKEMEE